MLRACLAVVLVTIAASAASAADFTGRWSGSFRVTDRDGKTVNDGALLVLEQHGASVTGTAGADEGRQSPIRNGKVAGDRLTFDFSANGHELKFDLRLVDGHVRGEAVGASDGPIRKATLDLQLTFEPQELERTVRALDAALFDAYNRCDLEAFGSYLDDDVEFYHDKGGVTLGRAALVDSVRKNVCGKAHRDLVPGSLEVYPIPGYGAMEIAAHRFCPPASAPCGESSKPAKTSMVWRFKDGAWKLTRVLSYAH